MNKIGRTIGSDKIKLFFQDLFVEFIELDAEMISFMEKRNDKRREQDNIRADSQRDNRQTKLPLEAKLRTAPTEKNFRQSINIQLLLSEFVKQIFIIYFSILMPRTNNYLWRT